MTPATVVAARAVPTLRVVAGGVDSLDLFWRCPLAAGDVEHLKQLQKDSQEAGRKGKKATILLGDERLNVQPNAARIGPLLLDNEHMSVVLNPDPLKGMPTVMIALKAFLLWQVGPDLAMIEAQKVVNELAVDGATPEQLDAHVTGLDLCVDVQGWLPTAAQLVPKRKAFFYPVFNEQLHTRASKFKIIVEKRFESAVYGTKASGISAEIYNKTLELEVSGKDWFEEIWQKAAGYVAPHEGPNGEWIREDVIRLEFRLKRKGLTEFMKFGAIENFSRWLDIRQHLAGLWTYLSRFWLVMRGKRSKSDRLANPITPFWQQLVDAGEQLLQNATDTVLRRKLHRVAVRGTAAAAGYLVQLYACEQWEERDQRGKFEEKLPSIIAGVRKYMSDKGWDPQLIVRDRYLREWTGMEHLQLMGEDVPDERWGVGA